MISVHDLQQGQKVDSQDVNGDWHTATIQSVKRKVKKPYATDPGKKRKGKMVF